MKGKTQNLETLFPRYSVLSRSSADRNVLLLIGSISACPPQTCGFRLQVKLRVKPANHRSCSMSAHATTLCSFHDLGVSWISSTHEHALSAKMTQRHQNAWVTPDLHRSPFPRCWSRRTRVPELHKNAFEHNSVGHYSSSAFPRICMAFLRPKSGSFDAPLANASCKREFTPHTHTRTRPVL